MSTRMSRSAIVSLGALIASGCTVNNSPVTTDGGSASDAANGTVDSGTSDNPDAASATDGATATDAGAPTDGAAPTDGSAGDAATTIVGNGCSDAPANNQTAAAATPYAFGTSVRACLRSGMDVNYYTYALPSSPPKGGYVIVKITDVGPQDTVTLATRAASDSQELISSSSNTAGGGAVNYFAAKPGATFQAVVKNYGAPAASMPQTPYTITVTFTGVNDPSSPNGTVATAAAMTAATPVQGYFFAGFDSSMPPPGTDWESWYKVTLPVGTATVALTNVPADVQGSVDFFDSTTNQVGPAHSNSTAGGNVQYDQGTATAGIYYLRVRPYGTPPDAKGITPSVPVWMTNPWTLTVTAH